jgi:hypothetical protein
LCLRRQLHCGQQLSMRGGAFGLPRSLGLLAHRLLLQLARSALLCSLARGR